MRGTENRIDVFLVTLSRAIFHAPYQSRGPDLDWSSAPESIQVRTQVDPPRFSHISSRGCGSDVPARWSITGTCLNEALESQFRHRYYATSFPLGLCYLCTSNWLLHYGPTWESRVSTTDQRFGSALGRGPSLFVPTITLYNERTIRKRGPRPESHGSVFWSVFPMSGSPDKWASMPVSYIWHLHFTCGTRSPRQNSLSSSQNAVNDPDPVFRVRIFHSGDVRHVHPNKNGATARATARAVCAWSRNR